MGWAALAMALEIGTLALASRTVAFCPVGWYLPHIHARETPESEETAADAHDVDAAPQGVPHAAAAHPAEVILEAVVAPQAEVAPQAVEVPQVNGDAVVPLSP
jgi:hypothetical protein